jgi:hypothetical protein
MFLNASNIYIYIYIVCLYVHQRVLLIKVDTVQSIKMRFLKMAL